MLGVNKAGWNMHSAVHSTRSDINCVAHLRLPDVVAVSRKSHPLILSGFQRSITLYKLSFGSNY